MTRAQNRRFARTKAEQELRIKLALAFHDEATRKGYCVVTHVRTPHLHAHHCIEASFIRRELKNVVPPERLEAIVWDVRNGIGVSDRVHLNHHWSSAARIYRHHIPDSAWELAKELDALVGDERFTVRLERYPTELREAA